MQSNAIPDPQRQSTLAQPTRVLESDRHADLGVLPSVAQAQIASVIGQDDPAYHALAQAQGFRVDNPGHDLSATFTSAGVDFHRGPNNWSMSLRGYGYGDMLRDAGAVRPKAAANRVEYRRGALTEWYVNGPLGLEQGFTLERAPANSNGQPLTLAFVMSGNLTASLDPAGRSLTLRTDKSRALRYGGLIALDADRRELHAWLELAGNELRVRVDDAGARYPLMIDPYVQTPRLDTTIPCDPAGVCDDGAAWNRFGHSVSISADGSTVVVGAPFKVNNNPLWAGAAYVFVKPDDFVGGWNSFYPNFFKAKLLASDVTTYSLQLGLSVDISRDGGTIVAGAAGNGVVASGGAAYVFIRPANGWGTFPVQTETAKLIPGPAGGGFDPYSSVGRSVAISGDGATIAAGAPSFGTTTNQTYGAAYLFLRPATGWVSSTESQRLTGAQGSRSGISVALSDDATTLVVGAYGKNPTSAAPDYTGAAHLYVRQNNPGSAASYAFATMLAASAGVPKDHFGWSVGANGDGSAVVVGAPGDEFDTIRQHGAAYVFVRPAAGWGAASSPLAETARLTTSDGNGTDSLGVSVDISLDGSTIVATTVDRKDGTPIVNAANFFARPAAGWSTSTEDTRVLSPAVENDRFGSSASLSGNGAVALFGAPGTTIDASLFQGAAYVFTGTAATPRASVSPASLAFGPQTVGTTSAPQTVTLRNPGSAPLHVSNVGVTGPFTATQNCLAASPIAPGGSCSATVAFAPFTAGPQTGTLTFTDDSGGISGTLQLVPLNGDGLKANTSTTIVSAIPNPVFVGGTMIVSFLVSAPGTITPTGIVTVQASTGESCTSSPSDSNASNACAITFSTLGPRTITATYTGNASFNPSTSSGVQVRAVDFNVSASPSAQTVTGRKANYKLTVTGLGGLTGNIAMGCSGGPPNATCAVSPSSVSLSGSTATAKATVTVPAGAANGTYTVTFTGTYGGVTRSATASLTVQ